MVYKPPFNISLGTYISDGLRTGPSYDDSTSNLKNINNQLIIGDHNKFGPGLLLSPFNTWDIVPYASTPGNIVAAAAIADAKYLTFTGDNEAVTKVSANDGTFYVQFDWPRVPAVVVAGAAMNGPTNVTIFGLDFYGFPLQHTYVVQNTGTYPSNLGTKAKAFWRIYKVYVDNTTGAGGTLAIQTTNIFGLPYVIKEPSYGANFSWAGSSLVTQQGAVTLVAGTATVNTPAVRNDSIILTSHQSINGTPLVDVAPTYVSAIVDRESFTITSANANDVSTIGWAIPEGGQNIIAPADTTLATAVTGDVRGLIQLPETGETWGVVPDGTQRLVYTPYVFGSDVFQNQLAAGNQPQLRDPGEPQTVPFLKSSDLYGVQQYYTGTL